MTKSHPDTHGTEPTEVEGRYTEVEGQGPEVVRVHGDYTAEEGHPAADGDVKGEYTDVEADPHAHNRDHIEGHFTDAESQE